MRGKAVIVGHELHCRRITPAYAGKSDISSVPAGEY